MLYENQILEKKTKQYLHISWEVFCRRQTAGKECSFSSLEEDKTEHLLNQIFSPLLRGVGWECKLE